MHPLTDTPAPGGRPPPPGRRARWFLVGLHVALAAVAPVFAVTGYLGDPGDPVVAVTAALAVGALQLRHSLAAARGTRPDGWPWTLAALLALVYLPMGWFTLDWAPMQYFAIASGPCCYAAGRPRRWSPPRSSAWPPAAPPPSTERAAPSGRSSPSTGSSGW